MRLILVIILNILLNFIVALNITVRLAGARTKKLALSLSIYSIIYIVANFSGMLLGPILASYVEHNIGGGNASHLLLPLRMVLLGSAVGISLAILFIPTFLNIFIKLITLFEEKKSIIRLGFYLLKNPTEVFRGSFKVPHFRSVWHLLKFKPPIKISFVLINTVSVSIWTLAIVSSLYAGSLFPQFRSTTATLANLFYTCFTTVTYILIDPLIAHTTDRVINGQTGEEPLKRLVTYWLATRLAGALLAQVFFVYTTYAVVYLAGLLY